MPVDREQVLPDDALERLARALYADVRLQYPQKPPGTVSGNHRDDVGTNLLAWLFDAYDDAFAGDGSD